MKRLIDANALKAYIGANYGSVMDAVIVNRMIDDAPIIDPVVHGRWIWTGDDDHATGHCSVCNAKYFIGNGLKHDYCSACGAKMDAIKEP